MDITINFDGQYRIEDNTDIGTVKILMLKGEKGDAGTSDYADVTNKPRINDYVLVGNKTAGQLGLANASDIPTKTSELTNDSGFITSAALPTKTSDLTNDSGFITAAAVPTDSDIVDLIYPVGSIYMSVNAVSPATLFGGTWTQIKDMFLLAAGDTYSNGSTGGAASHTLTGDELPYGKWSSMMWYSSTVAGAVNKSTGSFNLTASQGQYMGGVDFSFGNNQPHNNMPPYLTVNVWQRTA